MENVFKKIENKIDLKSLAKKIFVVFMILQPILDIYMSLFDEKIQIAGVSLATIIRFLLVFIMLVLVMIYTRKNKSTKFFIGYVVLVAIYTICHHINATKFSVNLVEAKYNPLNEILYLARMCIPPSLIYIIYSIKPNYKDIKKIVISVSLIISLVLIITNLTKVSYISYSIGKDKVLGNMFSWFSDAKNQYHWSNLSCRGLFQSGNQLSAVTVILVPIITYIALKEKKIRNWLVLTLHLIAMVNLTTRVGAVAGVAIVLAVVSAYILEKIIHKELSLKCLKGKNIYCFLVTVLVFGAFFINSPFYTRASEGNLGYDIEMNQQTANNTEHNVEVTDNDTDSDNDVKIDKIKYIEENIETSNINGYFIYQAYPYTQDPDFWYEMIANVPEYERAGNRKMRAFLIDRILEKDNRIANYIFGISFTRSSTFVWPERDFETQLDALGIGGVTLFIMPYIIVFAFGAWNFLKRFKENLYLSKMIYMISLLSGIMAAYLSGHVLNEVFPFTFLAMVTGIVLNMCMGLDPEKYSVKKNLRNYFDKLYPDGKEKFYEEIKESLKNNEKRFIVTANPETFMIAEKNEAFKNCLLKDNVTIVPDGIGIIKGAKMLGYPQKETITGVGLVEELFKDCDEMEKSIFLFGAKEEVVVKLEEIIKEKYPKAKVVGRENGYVKDKQKVFEKIKKLSPDLILVAVGIPHQELLIDANFDDFNKGIFIGVGGSFDVLSGMKKRAPKIFINLHLEWLYRITTEPKRLKRFVDSNIKYLFKIAEEK